MNAIAVEHLEYRYADGRMALADVSFRIEEGECVGLVGPNGAGKTTLLLHLNGVLPEKPVTASAVSIFGMKVQREQLHEVRRMVGLLFQDPDDQLFCSTVGEDVAFGPAQFGLSTGEVQARVREALASVGLVGYEERAPHHLSGGERRRVCLAGVLACHPRVLALDEPTSDLDPRGKRQLKELLRSIDAAMLIATHDLELVVELCPRVILLDEGRVIADGPTESILGDEELMLAHGLEKPHILRHRHPH
jgi:cobalt transport protein ATP-binding subunit